MAEEGKPPASLAATLAELHPSTNGAWDGRRLKHSLRPFGSFRSTLVQPTRLPAASRKYVPGDPVKFIDWRAYARTDQLMLRDHREEASTRIQINIDLSATMRWPDDTVPIGLRGKIPTKAALATRVGLHLAALHLHRGDSVSVRVHFDLGGKVHDFTLKRGQDVLLLFNRIRTQGFTVDAKVWPPVEGAARSTFDFGYWIGDGLTGLHANDPWTKCRAGCMFHILSSLEADASWIPTESVVYDEFQSGGREYTGHSLHKVDGYATQLQVWKDELKQWARLHRKSLLNVTDKTSVRAYLHFLSTAHRGDSVPRSVQNSDFAKT